MSANQPIYAMLTHPGRVRSSNEDACAACPDSGAYVVCDGMGGAAAGEVASRLGSEAFLRYLTGSSNATKAVTPQSLLTAAIEAANQAVFQKARHDAEFSGMGTTIVALLHVPALPPPARMEPIRDTEITLRPLPANLWLAHVGDSRCYLYRDQQLMQLTEDHSLVEEQLRAGQITPEEAANSPMRNLITRAVGSQGTVDVEVQSLCTLPGDLYLLASDGLNRELTDADIATILADVPSPPAEPYLSAACESLIAAANHNGGHDNITVLLLAFPERLELQHDSQQLPSMFE